VRGESGVFFILEMVDALPRRGARRLATACDKLGKEEIDKEASYCCASESRGVGRGLWRGGGCCGGRSAGRGKAKRMPARCLMFCLSVVHGRERTIGRDKV
jgi:hypothetical protein